MVAKAEEQHPGILMEINSCCRFWGGLEAGGDTTLFMEIIFVGEEVEEALF
jgi:hypothetical protein